MSNPSPSPEDLASRLSRYAAHFAVSEPVVEPIRIGADSVGASVSVGRRGRFWLRRVGYSPAIPWGETPVEDLCSRSAALGLRVPFHSSGERISLRDCLFVDCETTGLSGGAGTVAFLIAIGQYLDGEFVVDQYFLPDLADEAGALDAVGERLARAGALVTYNGAAFDLPLLEGRFVFWRLDTDFRELPHLDLLWPTRALFKHRLESCSLSTVEEQILRIARIEDLPGAEVPEVYFQYLRDGQSPRLHAVFEHNRLDVVSLFVYALWLDHHTDPARPSLASPDDLYALARLWHRHRQPGSALNALAEAETRVNDRVQRAAIHRLRGHVLKRVKEFEAASGEWRRATAAEPSHFEAAEELAKHLEHRQRDYNEALRLVDSVLKQLEFACAVDQAGADAWRTRFLHRRSRLLRKARLS